MKSRYLDCDDINIGDTVYVDEAYRKKNELPNKALVKDIGQFFALIDPEEGNCYSLARNRLTLKEIKER